jgi:hypothetical protein
MAINKYINVVTYESYLRSRLVQPVWCLTTDWMTGVRFPPETNLCIQTGSGAHPASCTVGSGCHYPGGKAGLGSDADHWALIKCRG